MYCVVVEGCTVITLCTSQGTHGCYHGQRVATGVTFVKSCQDDDHDDQFLGFQKLNQCDWILDPDDRGDIFGANIELKSELEGLARKPRCLFVLS